MKEKKLEENKRFLSLLTRADSPISKGAPIKIGGSPVRKFFNGSRNLLSLDPIGKLRFLTDRPTKRPKMNSTADSDDFT